MDQVSATFRSMFDAFGVSYDDYVRTTEARHAASVHALWARLSAAGFIYKGQHESWYCQSDESFLTESQVVEKQLPDGTTTKVSSESGHPVTWSVRACGRRSWK